MNFSLFCCGEQGGNPQFSQLLLHLCRDSPAKNPVDSWSSRRPPAIGILNYSGSSSVIAILVYDLGKIMADMPGYFRTCFHTGRLACLAMLVSGGIVLQILACALYNNWWPMLTVIMYVTLPMPLMFFAGSDTSSLYTESGSCWLNATKFLTGASTVGSIAIPIILKHAGVIGWGAMALELSSFFVFVLSLLCYLGMSEDDGYSRF